MFNSKSQFALALAVITSVSLLSCSKGGDGADVQRRNSNSANRNTSNRAGRETCLIKDFREALKKHKGLGTICKGIIFIKSENLNDMYRRGSQPGFDFKLSSGWTGWCGVGSSEVHLYEPGALKGSNEGEPSAFFRNKTIIAISKDSEKVKAALSKDTKDINNDSPCPIAKPKPSKGINLHEENMDSISEDETQSEQGTH